MARRKLHTKKLKKQIFIIGEGITEQIYFNQLKQYENLKSENKKIKFFEVNSCFELWFLLHFNYSSREYSNCKEVETNLKKNTLVSDYEKTEKYFIKKNLYVFLKGKLTEAISNSKKLNNSGSNTKCDIHKIIEELNIETTSKNQI